MGNPGCPADDRKVTGRQTNVNPPCTAQATSLGICLEFSTENELTISYLEINTKRKTSTVILTERTNRGQTNRFQYHISHVTFKVSTR